ncbi:MAG: 16S rRNA (guanine(527)-N(7))-methyltransferase RsmG [Eubacteriales bacterium]|nr:16S rRNA (guanine(527)-N(7))-methyltransferase RsmG [Eubacteriales bacterium]
MREYLEVFLEKMGLSATERQIGQMQRCYEMLVERNRSVNLTAVTEARDAALKHFADSLAPLTLPDFTPTGKLIDVGTGAGFPALPIKILCPAVEVVAMDAQRKKLAFIDDVIAELGLEGIRTLHARAEDAGRDPLLRETFDHAVARAVAPLPILVEYAMPFVRTGGRFIAYKGPGGPAEAEAAAGAVRKLGGVCDTVFVKTGDETLERCLCLVKKIAPTPSAYPRKAGIPEKKPL